MATVPTPYDAVPGAKMSAASLDAGIKTPLDWLLTNYPRVHAHNTAGTTITNATAWTLVDFGGETYDTDNMHDTVTNNSRIIFTTAGLYEVDYQVALVGSLTTFPTVARLNVRLNAAGASGGGTVLKVLDYGNAHIMQFRFRRVFAAADYIEIFVSQTSGVNKTLDNTGLATRVFAHFAATS